ncbi:MAG: M48 family metalloprotease [Candidatus Binatia bacterium]|nr:M48 family metalloprotease [Candidatus Binatia bacterium]
MPAWIVTLLSLCVVSLPVWADEGLEEALRELPPAQRAEYRAQLRQLDRVARRLLHTIPDSPRVRFVLAAGEPSVNAGATFDTIVVSEGMMRFVRTDDELAMILGHELAHITQGHVSRSARNNVLLGLGSLIVDAIYPGVGQTAGYVGQLFLNRFNQDQEREADRVGLLYAYRAGYDPRTAARVMQRMAEEVPETATAGFFSSHPSSVERFAALERQVAELERGTTPRQVVSDEPRPRGRFGRDEQACARAKPYFHEAYETPSLEQKVALYKRGLRLCPQSPRAHFELAEAYARLGEERRAIAALREVLRYDADYPGARARLRELEARLSRRHY